ncbi:MAG: sulfatase-like hydrolase/transferase [Alphaproteobacteria bacterium]|nr:sulfatase-like hydrolase/transferase [Alphaproteobacteria bacterium]
MIRLFMPLLALAMGSCAVTAPPHSRDGGRTLPNIVILLADDLGYGDLGSQGGRDVRTPNLDRLASEGVRLTDFYSNHPVCAPSRAALLTGKYQHRFGFENNSPMDARNGNGLPEAEIILAQRLKERGYATGMIGKWHLGFAPHQSPVAKGFDTFYGLLGGAMAFVPSGASGSKTVIRGRTPEPMPAHLTEGFGAEAVSFIEANKHQPFLLYVPFTAVHAPLQTTDAYLARFANVADPQRRTYLAMLAAMDDAVGGIIAAIDKNGLGRHTLIMFSSDNGGPTWQTTSANGPLNGAKALLLEGGIRVPTILRWTGHLPAGSVHEFPAMAFDLTATALAAVGASRDGLDGQNLLPHLNGESSLPPHDQLFWRAASQGAMREGDWKLLKVGNDSYLFNLRTDVGETRDLAATDPQRLARMEEVFRNWSNQMRPPAWGRTVEEEAATGRVAELKDLVDDMIAGRPTNPRDLLYGGGPE